jgi:hypothetical protein
MAILSFITQKHDFSLVKVNGGFITQKHDFRITLKFYNTGSCIPKIIKKKQKYYLFGAICDALVFSDLLVELQLRLDVLGGVGDADLDAAGDTSSDDSCKLIGTLDF